MDMIKLAEEIIEGRRLSREDDLNIFTDCGLDDLCRGADMIREKYIGSYVDLCSIINGRSGRCPEDCKYCAQSVHNHTDCDVYDFLPEENILEACNLNEREGVHRFSIVTAGKSLNGEEFEKAVSAYERLHKECDIELCASMGFLSAEQLHRLHEAGVSSYHHNIETSRRNFPNVCTTHTYDMKLETLKKVKAEGMCYSVAYDRNNRLPLFYEAHPGSINDVSQLQFMLDKAAAYGYKNAGFILDRGYFSEPNIRFMDKNGQNLTIRSGT